VIVSGGPDKHAFVKSSVQICEFKSGAKRDKPVLVREDSVTSVIFCATDDRTLIASGWQNGAVYISDTESGDMRDGLFGHTGRVTGLAAGKLHDRAVIISGSTDGTVCVWDVATNRHRKPILCHETGVSCVALATIDNSSVIASGGYDGFVRVWELESGRQRTEFLRREGIAVCAVAIWTLNGRPVIVSGGKDGTVSMWDLTSNTQRCEAFPVHQETHVALGIIAGRSVVVSGGAIDGIVRVLDENGIVISSVQIGSGINSLAFAPPGMVVVAADRGMLLLEFGPAPHGELQLRNTQLAPHPQNIIY
jgi:WD40 repeat protein